MAGAKEEARKEPEKEASGFDRKTIKKIFYGGNILLMGIAFFILLIMFFVAWDFIDNTEKLVRKAATDACGTLTAVESILISAEEEMVLLSGTIDGMDETFSSLSEGLDTAGGAMRNLDSALTALRTLGINLGEDIENTADSLEEASYSLENTTAGLTGHKANIADIETDIGKIRANVTSQKRMLCDQTEIDEIFGSMRLTIIILFVLAAALILIPFVNSAAGML